MWLATLLLPSAPLASPQQLAVSKNATSLSLSWSPPPYEDTNGNIQYFVISVTEVDTNTTFPPINSSSTRITLNRLHPYYVYKCAVAAYTVDIGPFTTPITVQLDQEGEIIIIQVLIILNNFSTECCSSWLEWVSCKLREHFSLLGPTIALWSKWNDSTLPGECDGSEYWYHTWPCLH